MATTLEGLVTASSTPRSTEQAEGSGEKLGPLLQVRPEWVITHLKAHSTSSASYLAASCVNILGGGAPGQQGWSGPLGLLIHRQKIIAGHLLEQGFAQKPGILQLDWLWFPWSLQSAWGN